MILGLWCTIPTTTNLSYSSNSNLLALKRKKERQYFASMQLFAFLLFPSLALSLSMSKEPSPCRSPQTIESQYNSFLVLFGPDCWKRCVLVVVGIYILFFFCSLWILKTLKSNEENTNIVWGFRISITCTLICTLFCVPGKILYSAVCQHHGSPDSTYFLLHKHERTHSTRHIF